MKTSSEYEMEMKSGVHKVRSSQFLSKMAIFHVLHVSLFHAEESRRDSGEKTFHSITVDSAFPEPGGGEKFLKFKISKFSCLDTIYLGESGIREDSARMQPIRVPNLLSNVEASALTSLCPHHLARARRCRRTAGVE